MLEHEETALLNADALSEAGGDSTAPGSPNASASDDPELKKVEEDLDKAETMMERQAAMGLDTAVIAAHIETL